jgi:hypothetical protein
LDHNIIKITLDTYSHVLPNLQEEAVNQIDALLPKSKLKSFGTNMAPTVILSIYNKSNNLEILNTQGLQDSFKDDSN